jgi:hypothetical protein
MELSENVVGEIIHGDLFVNLRPSLSTQVPVQFSVGFGWAIL